MTTGWWEPGEPVQVRSTSVQAHTGTDSRLMVTSPLYHCSQHQLKATMDSLTTKVPQLLLQQGMFLSPSQHTHSTYTHMYSHAHT